MKRHLEFRTALPVLVGLSLVGCGSAPPTGTPEAQGAGDVEASTPSGGPRGQLWQDPIPDPTMPVAGPVAGPAAGGAEGGQAGPAPTPAQPAPAPGVGPPAANLSPIAFASTRLENGDGFGFDIFIFDRQAATVLAVPGLNTPANETSPDLSTDGRWLVYTTDAKGNLDIYRYDMTVSIVDVLATVNTNNHERHPSISDDGGVIAYTSATPGTYSQLRLYDARTNAVYVPTAPSQLSYAVFDPEISGNGAVVAFSANDAVSSDIYVYNVAADTLVRPPFVNTPANERDPDMSADGARMLFVSDQGGRDEVHMVDLAAGVVDRLPALNAAPGGSTSPRFMEGDAILFQSNRAGTEKLYIHHAGAGVTDTLPIANEIGQDDILGDEVSGPGIGIGVGSGFGIGRDLFGRSGRRL